MPNRARRAHRLFVGHGVARARLAGVRTRDVWLVERGQDARQSTDKGLRGRHVAARVRVERIPGDSYIVQRWCAAHVCGITCKRQMTMVLYCVANKYRKIQVPLVSRSSARTSQLDVQACVIARDTEPARSLPPDVLTCKAHNCDKHYASKIRWCARMLHEQKAK